MKKILVGNTFPTTLIRRKAVIQPISIESLAAHCQAVARKGRLKSFWGHANTLKVVSEKVGADLTPKTERPAIGLTAGGLPTLDGEVFFEVYLLNPDYKGAYRPRIGEEVDETMISGWTALLVRFPRKMKDGRLT